MTFRQFAYCLTSLLLIGAWAIMAFAWRFTGG